MWAPKTSSYRSSGEAVPIPKPLDSFPRNVGGWQGAGGVIFDPDTLNVLKPNDYVIRRQDPQRRSLWLYTAYWDSQARGPAPLAEEVLAGSRMAASGVFSDHDLSLRAVWADPRSTDI
jgi:uncharacterized protein DUF3485